MTKLDLCYILEIKMLNRLTIRLLFRDQGHENV